MPKFDHVLHHFDEEISNLRQKVCNFGEEALTLWGLNHEALIDGNLKLASDVIIRQSESKMIQLEIDQAIIGLMAKEQPVASDLRFVMCSIKLAYEFHSIIKIADEMARLILAFYVPQHGAPDFNLIVDLSKLDLSAYYVVSGLIQAINDHNSKYSLQLFEDSALIESSVHNETAKLIAFIQANPHQISPALTILRMLKALESCISSCKNLARYCSYMIDGIDLQNRSALFM